MSVLDKDGKPVQKAWEQMDADEKVNALRQGIGYTIQLCTMTNQKLDKIVEALDQALLEDSKEPAQVTIREENTIAQGESAIPKP